jgi:hypothetical protein
VKRRLFAAGLPVPVPRYQDIVLSSVGVHFIAKRRWHRLRKVRSMTPVVMH